MLNQGVFGGQQHGPFIPPVKCRLDRLPAGTFYGGDEVPPGTFHGGDEVPPGTFHGGDEVPPGTFH